MECNPCRSALVVILVLELGLGKCCLGRWRPIHRFVGTVDETLVHHLIKDVELTSLKVLVHGSVAVLPVAHHAIGGKLASLGIDRGLRSGLGNGTYLRGAQAGPV